MGSRQKYIASKTDMKQNFDTIFYVQELNRTDI